MEPQPVHVLAYASWGRRVLSALIDSAAVSFLSAPFMGDAAGHVFDALSEGRTVAAADIRTVTLTNLVVSVVYMTAFAAWRGSTPGKMALRTVLVRDDGSPVTAGAAFVRAVTFGAIQFASGFVLFPLLVNELRPLWHPRRQTWHDQVSKTVVVLREKT